MKRSDALRKRIEFDRVVSSGRRVTRPEFVLYHAARDAGSRPRVGLVASRQVGGAVARNRCKRLLREAIRPLVPRLVACDVVVVARPALLEADLADIEAGLSLVTTQAGLIRTDPQLTDRGGPTPS